MGMENIKINQKPPQEIPQRLWLTNEVNLKLGVKEVKVTGKENIKGIPEGAKVVVMTTHMTDLDIPAAIHSVARDLDVVVMNESVHHKFWGKEGEAPTNIGIRIAGKKNFLPIDFQKNDSGGKSPRAFNPDNFEPAEKALMEGKAIMIVAHNPSQEPVQNLDNIRGGYGGVYLALLADAYILPVTVVLDHPAGMYEPNLKMLKNLINKPNASVAIGKPFKLEKVDGIERFSELEKKGKLTEEERIEFSRLADVLREKSQKVIKKMSDQLLTQS